MMSSKRPIGRLSGFTLVELLVLIGIIALLISIILPAVGVARQQAKVTRCAANLRQISAACNTYAVENGGEFPTLDMPNTGANLWDVPLTFVQQLKKQGVPQEAFFCPATQDRTAADEYFTKYSNFYILNYNVWIPRKNGPDMLPPAPNYSGAKYTIMNPTGPKFAGPASMGDVAAMENPIFSDFVGSDPNITPPADADPSQPGNAYGITEFSNHRNGERLESINLAFADGHVEFKMGRAVRPVFKGNRWNWK